MTADYLGAVIEAREIREAAAERLRKAAAGASTQHRPSPVATARSVYGIPHACSCDWYPPDYRYPPRHRAWTLPAADPQCRLHGTPKEEAA